MRVLKIIGWIAMGVAGVTAIGFCLGLVVMVLWNWLMPALFGLPVITYWQAVGLFVLCHLLFKGHGGGGHRRRPPGPRDGGGRFARKVRAMMGGGPARCTPEPAPADDDS
jgi:hypothetical protein